jgi:hypothetical protein
MVEPGASCSTRHLKNALAKPTAITMLTIDPAILSVLTNARLRRRSRKRRRNRSIGNRTMSWPNLWVRTNMAFPTDNTNRAT